MLTYAVKPDIVRVVLQNQFPCNVQENIDNVAQAQTGIRMFTTVAPEMFLTFKFVLLSKNVMQKKTGTRLYTIESGPVGFITLSLFFSTGVVYKYCDTSANWFSPVNRRTSCIVNNIKFVFLDRSGV